MKRFIPSLFILFSFIFLPSCSDYVLIEVFEEQLEEVLEPLPGGIVVIDYPRTVAKGDTARIYFRINPSECDLTDADLHIDALEEVIYDKYDDAAETKSQVSYITTPTYFKILGIERCVKNGSDTLVGQWFADFVAVSEPSDNYFDEARLALAIEFYDKLFNIQTVSSEPFQITIVPTVSDALYTWYQPSLSAVGYSSGKTPSAFLSFETNNYKERDGERIMQYSIKDYISSFNVILDSDYSSVFDVVKHTTFDEFAYLEFIPNLSDPKWDELKKSGDSTMTVTGQYVVTDIFGHTLEQDFSYTYYAQNEITFAFDVKHLVGEYHIDVTDSFQGCGLRADELFSLKRSGTFIHAKNLDVLSSINFIDADRKFDLKNVVYYELEPGEVIYDPSSYSCNIILYTMPSRIYEEGREIQYPSLDFKIVYKATIVE